MSTVSLFPSLTTSVSEPEATANPMVLNEHETTGALPVGFEFERSGVQFDRFDLSTDGFIRFAGGPYPGGVDGCLRLGAESRRRIGGGRLAYEVRGSAPRRRLVVSFAELGAPGAAWQLIVYERTGIVEVLDRPDQSLGDPTIRQLDMVQPMESRANSARKIG